MKYDNDGYPDRMPEPTVTISSVQHDALMAGAKVMARIEKALSNVRVMQSGSKVFIGVMTKNGCCSARVDPEDNEMFLEWKAERDVALDAICSVFAALRAASIDTEEKT